MLNIIKYWLNSCGLVIRKKDLTTYLHKELSQFSLIQLHKVFSSSQVQFNLQFTKPNTSLGDVQSGTVVSMASSMDKEK